MNKLKTNLIITIPIETHETMTVHDEGQSLTQIKFKELVPVITKIFGVDEKDVVGNIHWIAPKDEKVAEICKDLSGKVFNTDITKRIISESIDIIPRCYMPNDYKDEETQKFLEDDFETNYGKVEEQTFAKIAKDMCDIVEKAAQKKLANPRYKLSEEERVAVSVHGGAHYEIDVVEGKVKFTVNNVGILWIDGNFQVTQKKEGT